MPGTRNSEHAVLWRAEYELQPVAAAFNTQSKRDGEVAAQFLLFLLDLDISLLNLSSVLVLFFLDLSL